MQVAAEMIPLVVQYLQYGQSWMAFCSVHGISANQLYYWQGKCSRKSAASQGSAFLENSASDAGERVPMNVVYPGEVRQGPFLTSAVCRGRGGAASQDEALKRSLVASA